MLSRTGVTVFVAPGPDGTMTTEEWVVTYKGNPKIIDMHPCDAPAGTREAWDPDSEACQIPEEPEGDGGDGGTGDGGAGDGGAGDGGAGDGGG